MGGEGVVATIGGRGVAALSCTQSMPLGIEGQFTCRVCRSHAFTVINRLGHPKDHRYCCTTCSVVFNDPQKFSLTALILRH